MKKVFCAVVSLMCSVTVLHAQVPISASTVQANQVQTGNFVAGANGLGGTVWSPGIFSQGSWISYNQDGGSSGESDFINYHSGSLAGGFAWFTPSTSSLGSQVMFLSPGGTLTVNQVNANVTGNLSGNAATATLATTATTAGTTTGNAATATALASAPTNCGNGHLSYGIAANGNALCNSSSYLMQPIVITSGICTTGTSAYSTCSFSATWPAAFADTGYGVSCTSGPGQGSSAALTGVFVSNKTTTGFTITLQNGGSGGAGATTSNEVDCTGIHG